MTHSAPCAVSQELEANFRKATEDGSVRFFRLQIKEETIEQVDSHRGGSVIETDFDQMKQQVSDAQAEYFLFKLYNPKEWLFITYVPDAVPVRSKMVMASAKGTVKDKLGHTLFVDELHATTKDELSWAAYKGGKKQIESRSTAEVQRDEVHQQEEDARNELVNRNNNSSSSGGYHSVSIPLNESAKDAVNKLKLGTVNYVQLAIEDNKDSIKAVMSKNVGSVNELERELVTAEPRFYLYSMDKGAVRQTVLIYCCPDRSPPKWRMVYSTAKTTVADQVKALGVTLAPKKVELTDPSELSEALRGDLRNSPSPSVASRAPAGFTGRMAATSGSHLNNAPALGGTVKAANPHTIAGQHPIYALMGSGAEGSSTKKKIVIPPPAAYNG